MQYYLERTDWNGLRDLPKRNDCIAAFIENHQVWLEVNGPQALGVLVPGCKDVPSCRVSFDDVCRVCGRFVGFLQQPDANVECGSAIHMSKLIAFGTMQS